MAVVLSLTLMGCGGGARAQIKTDAEQKTMELTFVSPPPGNHHQQLQVIEPFLLMRSTRGQWAYKN